MHLNKYIDHTLLKPDTKGLAISLLCNEAVKFKFFSVCINSVWVPKASFHLKDSGVAVCTVVGFPLGASTSETKAFEAKQAISLGANEIDMVIDIGGLKEKDSVKVIDDIKRVKEVCGDLVLKVIIETSLLDADDKKRAIDCVSESPADFIKTSTGFAGGGATLEDIELMHHLKRADLKIKASGGVKTADFALQLIKAGAHRLGTSSGVQLVQGLNITEGGY